MATSWLNNRHARKVREMELSYQGQLSDERMRCNSYGEFLGTYMYVYGVISDIITIIERHEEDWIKRVSNIFSSRDFDEAMRKVNASSAYISIICQDESINECIERVVNCHEDLMKGIYAIKSSISSGDVSPEKIEQLDSVLKNLDKCLEDLSKLLRRDWKIKSPEKKCWF